MSNFFSPFLPSLTFFFPFLFYLPTFLPSISSFLFSNFFLLFFFSSFLLFFFSSLLLTFSSFLPGLPFYSNLLASFFLSYFSSFLTSSASFLCCLLSFHPSFDDFLLLLSYFPGYLPSFSFIRLHTQIFFIPL